MFQKVMNFFSPTSTNDNAIEMQEIRQSYRGVYMGGGEHDGKHNFFHIVFNDRKSAAAFAQRLFDHKAVTKAPSVTVANTGHPTYSVGTIYLRVHKLAFPSCKNLVPALPANFEDIKPYQSVANNSYRH